MRGRPISPGVALGEAVCIPSPGAFPILPARIRQAVASGDLAPGQEPFDVVLVGPDLESVRDFRLARARVVGVAIESDEPPVALGAPGVSGVQGIARAAEGTLVLVDGDHGIVLIDPAPDAVAAYQAERERIDPRRRIFLDFEHLSARTRAGRTVRVSAAAETLEEAANAVMQGADALYFPAGSPAMAPDKDDEKQLDGLLRLAGIAAGKPVTLAGGAAEVSIQALLRAAARLDVWLGVAADSEPDELASLRDALEAERAFLLDEDEPFGEVRLAALVDSTLPLRGGERRLEALATAGIARIILPALPDAEMAAAASTLLMPLELILVEPNLGAIHEALEAGVSGVIVQPRLVQAAKEAVRAFDPAP